MNPRRIVRALGLLLGVAAMVWIGVRFIRSDALSVLQHVPAEPWQLCVVLVLAAGGYAAALGLLAYAWWRLLAGLSMLPLPTRTTMATWSVSQYGKYLPGNVAHYALRHVWSRRQSIPHASLGLAAVIEAALLLVVALVLALLAGGEAELPLPGIDVRLLVLMLVATLFTGLFVLHRLRRIRIANLTLPSISVAPLVLALGSYVVFFASSATILWVLARIIGVDTGWLLLLGAGAASWAAGFVVIGAPAGLGIRETAFVAMTGSAFGEDRALLLIALYRLVTFFGDTLAFAAGAAVVRREREKERAASSRTT